MRFLAGLFFGFTMGILFVNLVLGSNSMLYKQGFEAGKNYIPPIQARIQKLHNITNMDSAIAKSKQMPSDSLNIILFNMYATKEERAMVKSFALWIKKASEVKE